VGRNILLFLGVGECNIETIPPPPLCILFALLRGHQFYKANSHAFGEKINRRQADLWEEEADLEKTTPSGRVCAGAPGFRLFPFLPSRRGKDGTCPWFCQRTTTIWQMPPPQNHHPLSPRTAASCNSAPLLGHIRDCNVALVFSTASQTNGGLKVVSIFPENGYGL